MSRKEHTLKPTKGKDRPTNVIFFDTETYEEPITPTKTKHRLKLGVAVYCRSRRDEYLLEQREISIRSGAEFWADVDRMIRPKSKYYLVAHNILFDLTVLDVAIAEIRVGLADIAVALRTVEDAAQIDALKLRAVELKAIIALLQLEKADLRQELEEAAP